MYSAVENTPIVVDLVAASRDTGWTVDGVTAYHSSCNAGSIPNASFPVTANQTYEVSYSILSISAGYVQMQSPGSNGAEYTTSGAVLETITPTSNGYVSFYSNAICAIESFNIHNISDNVGTTLAYSMEDKGWSDFRTLYLDWGWSIFDRVIVASNGALYASENGSSNTNNFFGTKYQSSIKVVFAKNPTIINTYEVLSYQANMLLVSTVSGITTPTGQVTTLIESDFLKETLTDGTTTVISYNNDGVYSASFKGDELESTIEGSPMRGNYITVELVTVDGSTPLELFSLAVKTARTWVGNR